MCSIQNCQNPKFPGRTICLQHHNEIRKSRYKRTSVFLRDLEGPEREAELERRRIQINDASKRYQKKHKQNIKIRYRQKKIAAMLIVGKGEVNCKCCGITDPTFLNFDHVNNDGANDKIHRMTKKFYNQIINGTYPTPENLTLLCWNCNLGKYMNNGICPHEEEK